MKKMSLIMIVVWSCIGLAIIAILMLSIIFKDKGGFNPMPFFDMSDKSSLKLVADESISMNGIDKIEFDFSSDECNIYISNDDNIGIKHYAKGISDGRYARIEGYGSTLAVSTKPESFLNSFSLFGFTSRSVIEIYLPKEYKNDLSVKLMSGTILFDGDLDLNELSVHVSSGTIRSEHAVKASSVALSVTSGKINITDGIISKNYTLKTSSGNLTVDGGLTGSGSVNVTSGKVKLFGVDITEDLSVKVSSGTIDIGIAGNPSLRFSGKRSSGTIRTYFGLYNDGRIFSSTVGEEPYKNLDVSVTSGTIRITQE